MALAVGTRLGAYEITGELGAGGMGEVYRATDTKLGRDVAIKTLPATLASDQDRLARFEREAKLLAALNHAHIGAIYGLDEHEGTLYIAMELVEGETLEEKLKAGPLPVDDALRLALQIAEALEAAHEKGVVHRDLKPANIMVTANGQVKVLDFGLAKAFSGNPEEASPLHSPALSVAMTQQGLILGTAAYMSPEQASGQATDQRADIWAFGVVLYEMLTGLPLFSGESVPHILADVLRMEPDWNRLPKNLHPRLRLLLERCLEKKVRNRYHSIAEARVDIEKVLGDPQGVVVPQAAAQVAVPARSSAARVVVAVVATGVVVGASVAWSLWPTTPPRPVNRFSYDIPQGQILRSTSRSIVALSPDGRRFVYNTAGGLYLRSMGDLKAAPIPGTEGVLSNPIFSPDGQSVAYTAPGPSSAGQLKRIAISGGTAVVIADDVGNPFGVSWGSDGTIFYAERRPGGIFRVSANGGKPKLVIPAKEGETLYGPELLPDGDSVLFSVTTTGKWDDADVVAQSLSTGTRTVLVKGGSDARYVAGRLIYALGDALFGVAFDPKGLTASGGAVPLVQGVMRGAGVFTAAANYAVSKDGTLVYASGTTQATAQLTWVDSEGHETPAPTPPREYYQVVLSHDGTHAALGIRGDKSVWMADLGRGTLERLPADLGQEDPSILFFSADGQRVASSAVRDGRYAVVSQAVDGTGAAETLATFDASVKGLRAGPLSPDGKQFVPTVFGEPGTGDFGIVTVGDPKSYRNFLATPAGEGAAAISPDGHWIAYTSNDTGTFQVYVQRFPEGGGRLAVSIKGGAYPHWSADGSALTYLQPDGQAVSIARVPVTGLEGPKASPRFGAPKELFPWKYLRSTDGNSHFDMTADGKRFLVIAPTPQDTETTRLVVVTNWVQELKRLVPPK